MKHRLRARLLAVALMAGSGAAQALEMGVFGDMSLADSNMAGEPSFRLGSLDLYALQYIDDRTKALFETQFQTFSGGDITVEIQRFWIMREVNRSFNIGLGRFHTPLGYWNRHFHHGILMQDTVTRPFFLAFEGGVNAILPAHLIGALAEGEIGGGLRYEAAVANSNTIDSSSTGERLAVPNRVDLSSNKSIFARLFYEAYGQPFSAGVTFMRNDVLEAASPETEVCAADASADDVCSLVPRGEPLVRQTLLGLDLRYQKGRFGALSEIYFLRNDAHANIGDGGEHDSLAWFAQFGYRITDRLLATYRYESLDFDNGAGGVDSYYMDPRLIGRNGIGTDERHVFALRYDFSESNALLLETSRRDPQLGDDSTATILSWAFVMY